MPGIPGLGFNELLVVLAVALIVLGPRRLPEVARVLGKVMGDLRRTADELRHGIEREVRMEELKQTAGELHDAFRTPVPIAPRVAPGALPRGASPPDGTANEPDPPAAEPVEPGVPTPVVPAPSGADPDPGRP